jgi:hypothetical protein
MRRQLAAGFAVLACAATLAACGGGNEEPERRAEPPKIPSALADELAQRSDTVAEKLEAGDICGAAREADVLEDRVETLIAAGEIPQRYERELESEAIWLRDNVNCPDPPAPPEDDEDDEEKKEEDEKGKDDNKGKGNGEGNGNDEGSETVTLEIPTLEEGE